MDEHSLEHRQATRKKNFLHEMAKVKKEKEPIDGVT